MRTRRTSCRANHTDLLSTSDALTLFDGIARIHASGTIDVPPSELTGIFNDLLMAHSPPVVRGRAIRLRYAHAIDSHPPSIMVHGIQTGSLPSSYKRYLENGFREVLDLKGWPVVIKDPDQQESFRRSPKSTNTTTTTEERSTTQAPEVLVVSSASIKMLQTCAMYASLPMSTLHPLYG